MKQEEIPTYSNGDNEIWEHWISNFEENAAKHSFDDAKKIARLASRLVYRAKDAFNELAPVNNRKYSDIIACLTSSLYAQTFVSKPRKQTQRLHEYSQELLLLAQKAYPKDNKEQSAKKCSNVF